MITMVEDLPTEVRNALSYDDQAIWMDRYNMYMSDGAGPYEAKEMAWLDCRYLDSSRYVCANVSTEIVDREGDLAVVEEYVKAGQELIRNGGILTKNHSNKVIGTVWKIEKGVDEATGKNCVLAYMNYFRGTMLYDSSWMEFKAGRTEFSIGSFIQKPERKCDMGKCYNVLIPEQWFELSNVDRGINPRTYPVDINEASKGEVPKGTIVEMHDEVCPAKKKYLAFKSRMRDYGYDTNYGEDFILIHGLMGEDELAYIYEEYPDVRQFEILMGDDGDYTLITPKFTVNEDIIDTEDSSVADMDEASKGACPAGQHEHAGVAGCHDILRRHQMDDKTVPTDALDLTDENIDISAIKNTPTERLTAIVTKIASVLSHFGDDAVGQFLSSTQGKEFVLAFLELKKRKMNGETNMTEKEAGCDAPKGDAPTEPVEPVEEVKAEVEEVVEETDKGSIPDIQSSIANISSTLASITALVDQMNVRLMKLEDSDLESEGSGNMSITDAITSSLDAGADIPPTESVSAEKKDDEDKGEVPPQFEKDEDADASAETSTEDSTEDAKVEGDSETKDDDEAKDDADGESEGESKEDDSKDDSDGAKDDDSKDDSKEESKDDDAKDDSDKKDDEDDDKEKSKGEEITPAEPVAEPAPAPVEEVKDEPVSADPAPVVAPTPTPAPEMELPIPPGGQTVDFRAMFLQRRAELAQKGVEVYIAESEAQNSLATVPIQSIKGTNVTLIHPPAGISAFDAESGIRGHSMKDALTKMGTMNSNDFIKSLIGE